MAEDFNWVGSGGVSTTETTLSNNVPSTGLTYTQDTGNYTVGVTVTDTTGGTDLTTLSAVNSPYDPANYGGYFTGAGHGISTTSGLKLASSAGIGNVGTIQTSFTGDTGYPNSVENVYFAISNLDRGNYLDSVRITACNGTTAVPVTLTIIDGGSGAKTGGMTLSNGSTSTTADGGSITGTSVTASANNLAGNVAYNNNDHQILVSIAGPITGFTVEYIRGSSSSGNTSSSYIYLSDIIFDPGTLPKDGIVEGTANADLIDVNYLGDPEGDKIDAGDNTLAGVTAGGAAGSNDDLVQGFGGNDTIQSGLGNDTVYAGSGDDRVVAGDGNDVVYGDLDTIGGTAYTGNDSLDGGAGNDKLYGGAGADTLLGGTGADTLDGGAGSDVLNGGAGSDVLDGGADDDDLTVGSGDTAQGGAGDDVFIVDPTQVSDAGTTAAGWTVTGGETDEGGADTSNGGKGDVLDMAAAAAAVTATLSAADIENGTVSGATTGSFTDIENLVGGAATTDKLDASGATTGQNVTYTSGSAGTVTQGADTITFSSFEQVATGAGNDTINAATATSGINVNTGAGNDTITGSASADTIAAGSGNDVINAGGGADSISAGDGSDTINGGDGADTIDAGAGDDDITVGTGDTALGGAGDDDFTLTPGGTGWTITGGETNEGTPEDTSNNADDGGMAGDKIDGSGLTSAVTVTYTTDEAGSVTGGAAGSFSEIEKVVTGSGNDVINAGTATVTDGTGINVDTGAGNDTITGSSAADTIASGTGDDSVLGGGGNDVIDAGAGNDTVYGGSGADAITAGDGNDLIVMEPSFGNDTIVGGEGGETNGDTLSGGGLTAPVTVTYTGDEAGSFGDGTSTATFSQIEKVVTGSGNDTINASGYTNTDGSGINVDTGAGNDSITGSNGADTIAAGDGADTVNAGAGNDSVDGGAGNDVIAGGQGDDTLVGGAGNDSLAGGDGTDSLSGGVGSDTLNGGNGNDLLDGGADDDLISVGIGDQALGGGGDDIFQIDANQTGVGTGVITGGEADEGGADTTLGSTGDTLSAANVITGMNVSYSGSEAGTLSYGSTTFQFSEIEAVKTGTGNDMVNAAGISGGINVDTGAGNDTILGGQGADTIAGGAGADSITGGAGDDVINLGVGDGVNDTISLAQGSGADTVSGFLAPTDSNGDGIADTRGDQFNVTDLTDPTNGDGVQASDLLNGNGSVAAATVGGVAGTLITFPNGETVFLPGVDPTSLDTAGELFLAGIPCFASGTLIETDRGAVAIETLAEGDLVLTRDNGLQPIRWIGRRSLSAAELAAAPQLRPIRIRRHALGLNLPSSDLVVSPQHRVLVRSVIAQKMFGAPEVLVAAKQLCQIEGIDIAEDMAAVDYHHMLFDRHEVVISNGAETESLYTGPEALKSVGPAARAEIFAIFPELADRDYTPVAARVLASGRMARKLAVRHAQNHKALVN